MLKTATPSKRLSCKLNVEPFEIHVYMKVPSSANITILVIFIITKTESKIV